MALAAPCRSVRQRNLHNDRMVVDQMNGVRIEKLEDAVRAFESNTNAFDVIEFLPHHVFECLDHNEVARANPRIQKTYFVPTDRRLVKPLNRIGSAPSCFSCCWVCSCPAQPLFARRNSRRSTYASWEHSLVTHRSRPPRVQTITSPGSSARKRLQKQRLVAPQRDQILDHSPTAVRNTPFLFKKADTAGE